MTAHVSSMRKGSPLALIALVITVWVGARTVLWENPFPLPQELLTPAVLLANNHHEHSGEIESGRDASVWSDAEVFGDAGAIGRAERMAQLGAAADWQRMLDAASTGEDEADFAFGHQMLFLEALGAKLPLEDEIAHALEVPEPLEGVTPLAPPVEELLPADRWSMDAWAFWRQGSNAAPISQGRVPVYGASQLGALLQYRVAPNSGHDPRLFVRSYKALVSGGETEVSLGASARPIASVPLRFAAEMRVTENRFGNQIRPAAFAVSELPPLDLIVGFRLEAYGGAGYVGGKDATPFVDGQAAVTRDLAEFEGPQDTGAKLSVGAGTWGGAQKGASRVDVGPTVRLDLTIGKVPARLSVDWREQVRGDAAPDAGVAATLSTRF